MGFKSRPSGKRVYLTFEDGKSHRFWEVTPDTLKALVSNPIFEDIDLSWSHAPMRGATRSAGFNNAKDLHFGDLHVRGDLEVTEHLTVLGNLRVDGTVLQDTHVGLLVTGDLQARAFDAAGPIWVLGEFQGDYLHLDRWSFLDAAGEVKARLVVRHAHEAFVYCDFKAAHFLDRIMLKEEEYLASLSNILVPSAMKDWPYSALALAGEGKPFFKSATAAMKNFPRIAPEY